MEALIDATPEVSKSILPPPVEEREASCRRACLTLLENILKVDFNLGVNTNVSRIHNTTESQQSSAFLFFYAMHL